MKLIKKHTIKVPENTIIVYLEKQKIITIIGKLTKKSILTELKLNVDTTRKNITVTQEFISINSNTSKKKIKMIQGSLISKIKQTILETSVILHKKLKLIGVGYKVSNIEVYREQVVQLKLGYTHLVFFKINKDKLKVACLKSTNLFIFGNSYYYISQIASKIRSYKKPEPYKGKGILYVNEKIILKEGKKI